MDSNLEVSRGVGGNEEAYAKGYIVTSRLEPLVLI
ncbi:uncharacterized protein G2W53_039420 [Senna tora]|uniref:Uncharacterized protein n=1 Tax=Senna tora TaxID=362788 RepID=A0A834W7Y1_9FABA|nr:uncharacterized protein G2W53_039420 [Senna tora]